MQLPKQTKLSCPLDGAPLELIHQQLQCPHGHSFDVARQGYVNLLPVQQKRSKSPGDSKEMVMARSRFLNTGVYQPIADKLNAIALDSVSEQPAYELLDAGCGEGYYLQQFYQYLSQQACADRASLIGLDISKPAVVAAAKRNKQITWLVGTNKQPPLMAESVDVIVCVFGFPSYEGFRQVLKNGGTVILVEQGPEHLIELRRLIYPQVKKMTPPDFSAAQTLGFSLQSTETLCFKSGDLERSQIADLLAMTPHLYRATQEGKQLALALEHIDLTVDVVFRTLQLSN